MLQFNGSKCKVMKIRKAKETIINQTLEVDSWKIEHDKNGNIIEEYIGKVKMAETMEHKYLGFVLFSYASNVPTILSKQYKSIITQRNIINICKDLEVKTF